MRNKGYEFELKTVNLDINDFRWETRFNFTHVKNEVTQLLPGQDKIGTAIVVGRPINSILTQQWAGINPGDGRPMWYDTLGNITYQPVARDRKYLDGTLDPTWFGGLTNEFSYKGITLRVFLQLLRRQLPAEPGRAVFFPRRQHGRQEPVRFPMEKVA